MVENDRTLELYKIYRGELMENLNLHRATIEHYLTFTVAVLGAIVAGSTTLQQLPWLALVLALAAVLNCYVCVIATRMCDRYYTGILDRIAIVAKLESCLHLSDPLAWKAMADHSTATPFPGDVTLVPRRWIEGVAEFGTSADFVAHGMRAGVNLLAKRTFMLVVVINLLLATMLALFYASHIYRFS
jgi:hypothetical protein